MRAHLYVIVLIIGGNFLTDARADCGPFGGGGVQRAFRIPHYVVPANAATIKIELSETATEPRFIVPKALASRATKPAPRQGAFLNLPSPALAGFGFTLSVGIVAAGLCLARGRRRATLVLIALTMVSAGAGVVCANMPPPIRLGPPAIHMGPKSYPQGLPLDNVAVEFVDSGDTIRLILPRRVAAELAEKLNATEAKP